MTEQSDKIAKPASKVVQHLSAGDVRRLEDEDTPTIWSYIVPHLLGWGVVILLLFGLLSFTRPFWEPELNNLLGKPNALPPNP